MAALAKLLKKKRKGKKGAIPDAVRTLNKSIESLKKRNTKIEKKIGKYTGTDEENVLERICRLEKEWEQNDEKISRLNIQADDLEHAGLIAEVAKTFKFVSEALRNTQTVSTMGMVQ